MILVTFIWGIWQMENRFIEARLCVLPLLGFIRSKHEKKKSVCVYLGVCLNNKLLALFPLNWNFSWWNKNWNFSWWKKRMKLCNFCIKKYLFCIFSLQFVVLVETYLYILPDLLHWIYGESSSYFQNGLKAKDSYRLF